MTDTKTTPEFQPGDRVRVAEDAAWGNGSVTAATLRVRGREATVSGSPEPQTGDYPLLTEDSPNQALIAPQYLTLVKPETASPTPEQVDAYAKLRTVLGGVHLGHLLDALDPLLPSTLTRPLPTEPGPYQQESDGAVVILGAEGGWWRAGNKVAPPTGTLVRLVPKPEPITLVQVERAVTAAQSRHTFRTANWYRALHAALLSGVDHRALHADLLSGADQ